MTFLQGKSVRERQENCAKILEQAFQSLKSPQRRPGIADTTAAAVLMQKAKSAEEFVNRLEKTVNGLLFDDVLASASYSGLAKWKRRGELPAGDKTNLLLDRLNRRVKERLDKDKLNLQTYADILLCISDLSGALTNALDVVPAVAARISLKAKGMKPRELCIFFLALAKLKDDVPGVLRIVPGIAAHIFVKAKDMNPQELSVSLWASAKLKDDVPVVLRIVPAIAAQIPLKSKDMNPQELSSSLVASAIVKDDAPHVLSIVPAIAAQIRLKAKDMNPQELCIFLLETAILKDDAPDVLSIVPAIAAQIRLKAKDMNPQEVCIFLRALAILKDDAPDVLSIVPAIAAQIKATVKNRNLQDLSGPLIGLLCRQEFVPDARSLVGAAVMRTFMLIPKAHSKDLVISLPVIAWACARVELHWTPEVPQLLKATAERLGSMTQVSTLSAWSLCALYESYKVLDPSKEFKSFEDKLKAEISNRGLSASDVESSINGPWDWGRAKR